MNHHQFMELLKGIKDDEFDDLGLCASTPWLSLRLLIPIQTFLETKKYLPNIE